MVTTTVHLLRHGEVHNPTGVLYGRLDGYHLSERGVAMAERIAAHLAGAGPDGAPRRDVVHVVASPLHRAQVARMLAGITAARDAALGHEAVVVSHQLPIWVARQALEGKRLWHDPRRRQCSLASVTSVTWVDDRVRIAYTEPALDLLPDAPSVAGA